VVFFGLFFGLLPFLGSGYMLAGALGFIGHRGVLTATSCATTGIGRDRRVTCSGELVVPHQPPRYDSIDAELPLDRATPVQVLGGRDDLETVGPAAVSGWSTIGLGGLTVLTAASLVAFRKRLTPPSGSTGRRLLLALASLTLTGLVVYLVVRAVT
jgi:hypothetical protein